MPPSKEIKTFKKQIAALSQISQAVSSNLLLDDILRLIVTVTAEVMDSRICSLMLVDEKKRVLVVRATQSISEDYNQKPDLKIGEGIAGRVAEEKKPLSVLDVKRDPRYINADIAIKEGLCSLLCVRASCISGIPCLIFRFSF